MNKGVRRLAVLIAAATCGVLSGGASAQSTYDNSPWYGAAMAGYVIVDSDPQNPAGFREYDWSAALHGVIGYNILEALSIEFNGFGQQNEREFDGRADRFYGGGVDMNLGTLAPWSPFFLVGGGAVREDYFQEESTTSPYANVGLGLLLPGFARHQQVRIEGRWNVVFYNDDNLAVALGDDTLEDVRINVGLQFGAGPRRPPTAPPVVTPDEPAPAPAAAPVAAARGDADGDGVPDDMDQCPDTPKSISATPTGCTPDSDGDGVLDDVDRCPGTATDATVDEFGCEPSKDSDSDGVTDDKDRCPGTPAGVRVDANGCPVVVKVADSDGDGVPDGVDQCPNTPANYQVDERGCVIVQKVVLTGVNFAFASDKLVPEAANVLDSVAESLKRTPTLRVEVGGHTDSIGSAAYNLALSQRRARAVRDYLVSQGVPSDRVEAQGYGLTKPVADNSTDEGRARNRRVEFRVLQK